MSSLTNINNNSSVINVGRTTPVNPGAAPANESIPVVLATDQKPIPVIEQQKIQSEVALSMLGIPRGEVALGIFSDVNTYDVNPSEWASFPEEYVDGHGIKHLPQEAGAIIQAPKDKVAILSSKRFFRYQPGRVSSATFGVKASVTPPPTAVKDEGTDVTTYTFDLNPSIKKYGIFDKFDGYYWETRGDSTGDNFAVVRRTQSLINLNSLEFGSEVGSQADDYRMSGKAAADSTPEPNAERRATEIITDKLFTIIDTAYNNALTFFGSGDSYTHLFTNSVKCKRDTEFALNAYLLDIQYGKIGHTVVNATTYRTAKGPTAAVGGSSAIVTGGTILSNDAKRTAENKLHELIGVELISALSGISTLNGPTTSVATRITALVAITRAAVGLGSAVGVQPTPATLTSTSTNIWGRNKLKTISSIYKRYLGYLISESFVPGAGSVTVGDVTKTYTTLYNELKYKCLRDVGYVVEGYMKDLAGGGNTATVYNMKNFYFYVSVNPLQVYSTFAANYTAIQFHIDAHELLRTIITKSTTIATTDNPANGTVNSALWDITKTNLIGKASVLTLFGLTSLRTRVTNGTSGLADLVINNFTTPYKDRLNLGLESQHGDLIVLRDGLIHVHAGVYDPSLLKETKKVRAIVEDLTLNTLHVAQGEFVVDQTINFISEPANQAPGGLVSNKFYGVKSVSGPLANVITLYDLTDATKAEINITTTTAATDYYIEPNVPFVFPDVYQRGTDSAIPFRRMDGMFPYMYVDGGNLPKSNPADLSVGYIDTAINTTTLNYTTLRNQIDVVNFKYNNWVKQNVDPRYYAVYEYRVPRSRFSTDKLNGINEQIVYSDVATGESTVGDQTGITKVRPGQNVTIEGVPLEKTSVWNIDLTKVTMLKVEFSWYGAVGALFLAYVPVGNAEARWVRVHHLRASNQLKISSLGNATLPITYLTYGGGTAGTKLGIPDLIDKTYGSVSNHIVKYGASYYIDGGDRGTVRLYSHTNIVPTKVYGRTYNLTSPTTFTSIPVDDPTAIQYPYITLNALDFPTIDRTFFMKAQVVTSNVQDQNVQVIWVDGDKLYLNKSLGSTANVRLISKRPSISFGLKAKQNIFNSEGTGIRNRVQVYPTKLSTANFETVPITLDIVKSPVFQTETATTGDFILNTPYTISTANSPLTPATGSVAYLTNDGDETYGWFLSNVGTVFGKLYKQGGSYYFELRDVFPQEVVLFATFKFLKDGRFGFDGSAITSAYESTSQKERLSSVFISNVVQTPIPDTGSTLTSFFLSPGSNQFDLLSYFDYNKDYLSFPLTDKVESIYLSGSLSGSAAIVGEINTSITWEEQ